ncbi:MAG: hypothetical protein RBU45_07325 [Myxococcota bacterium]|jgi:hypothetical protein|nr:hypothetical protein [Myxococcota bacterium]
MPDYIVTSFYADAPGEESRYAQVTGMASSSARFHQVYYRCVAVLMASSRQQNPGARHLFVCNRRPLPTVDGVDLGRFLQERGVELAVLPMTYAPPPGYCSAWRATFYMLDVVEHLAQLLGPDDTGLVLDCDCLCLRSLQPLSQLIRAHGLLTYREDYPLAEDINGLSRLSRIPVFEELSGRRITQAPPHVGGELLGLAGSHAAAFVAALREVWQEQLRRLTAGRAVLPTEEHLFSYLAWRDALPVGEANRHCRRVWTSLRHSRARPADLDLALWHLPSEKQAGLRRLWRELIRGGGPLHGVPGPDHVAALARRCGIPHRGPEKLVRDLVRQLGAHAARRWRG